MVGILGVMVGWVAWAWCILFALGFVQMIRRQAHAGKPYPQSAPVLAFLSLLVAIVFLYLPEVSKLHILWVWPVTYGIGTIGSLGGLGTIGDAFVQLAEPFHRLILLGVTRPPRA